MKALGILGTSSNAGKSWFATALCAWLRRQGVRVAPFKSQNMSNNACATLDGGEIGIAQAVQAAACGLAPRVEMNPILLKPVGDSTSQVVRLGKAVEQVHARDYYQTIEDSWQVVRETLDGWQNQCDVLVMEGAGSPVELNIVDRDIANLRPIRYVNGKWILVADIERGGVFAQIAGTWALMSPADQAAGLGHVINKFRGDTSLFPDPTPYLAEHCTLPYLGLLPQRNQLQIDEEDSLCLHNATSAPQSNGIAWVRLPQISNSQDIQAWRNDTGLNVYWASTVAEIEQAAAIILPGSKNTLQDLAWLQQTGLAAAIQARAQAGVPVVGICGGYQMLGTYLSDPTGVAGLAGHAEDLGLLPLQTEFHAHKTVAPRQSHCKGETWDTYEIHSGRSQIKPQPHVSDTVILVRPSGAPRQIAPLLHILHTDGTTIPEGSCHGNIWGSYQHGLFDGAPMRQRLVEAANLQQVTISPISRKAQADQTYSAMADLLETCLDMQAIKRELAI